MNANIKAAILEVLKERIDRDNFGQLSRVTASPRAHNLLWENGIRIEGNTVTQNGKPVYRIIRNYAARKVNGMYKQLAPKLEAIPA